MIAFIKELPFLCLIGILYVVLIVNIYNYFIISNHIRKLKNSNINTIKQDTLNIFNNIPNIQDIVDNHLVFSMNKGNRYIKKIDDQVGIIYLESITINRYTSVIFAHELCHLLHWNSLDNKYDKFIPLNVLICLYFIRSKKVAKHPNAFVEILADLYSCYYFTHKKVIQSLYSYTNSYSKFNSYIRDNILYERYYTMVCDFLLKLTLYIKPIKYEQENDHYPSNKVRSKCLSIYNRFFKHNNFLYEFIYICLDNYVRDSANKTYGDKNSFNKMLYVGKYMKKLLNTSNDDNGLANILFYIFGGKWKDNQNYVDIKQLILNNVGSFYIVNHKRVNRIKDLKFRINQLPTEVLQELVY